MQPTLEEFVSWPTAQIAQYVRDNNVRVGVLAINGTRRWFRLEYPDQSVNSEVFMNAMIDVNIRLCRLLYEHGVDTLILPVFGPELLARTGYDDIAWKGLDCLANHPRLREFFSSDDVRVRFYGDYCHAFNAAPWSDLIASFNELVSQTAPHQKNRLFLGVCAQNATETIARLAIEFYNEHARVPNKKELIRLYYGEELDVANFFIGFDRFCAFDMPLVDNGNVALYFTVCPSPYLTTVQFREILYDYICLRNTTLENEHKEIEYPYLKNMQIFYDANQKQTQGIGFLMDGIWYPSSHVVVPPGMQPHRTLPTTGQLRL
jgi:adenosine tuberculosinyltransferase